jgi:inositol hexakisphosphate/diphosphoinositol-pentakisphosphate kinase
MDSSDITQPSPTISRLATSIPNRAPSPSPAPKNAKQTVVLGVCAMDVKARSKAMREILTRLVQIEQGGVDVKLFGDVVILEEGECLSCLYKSLLSNGNMTVELD